MSLENPPRVGGFSRENLPVIARIRHLEPMAWLFQTFPVAAILGVRQPVTAVSPSPAGEMPASSQMRRSRGTDARGGEGG
jgi:hypothetical protein